MIQTVEAVMDPSGAIRLREPVTVTKPTRVLVTLLPENPVENETAFLSEVSLGADWNRPEEDAAWEHLQPGR